MDWGSCVLPSYGVLWFDRPFQLSQGGKSCSNIQRLWLDFRGVFALVAMLAVAYRSFRRTALGRYISSDRQRPRYGFSIVGVTEV